MKEFVNLAPFRDRAYEAANALDRYIEALNEFHLSAFGDLNTLLLEKP